MLSLNPGSLCLSFAVLLFAACDEEEYEACQNECSDQEEVCMDTCVDTRDQCKAPCIDLYPEYMNCYWDCRVENCNNEQQTADCLVDCAGDFDPMGEAVACVENCDDTYDTCEVLCFKSWWECDEEC